MKHSKSFKHERAKINQNLPNQSNTIHSVATNFNQSFKVGKHEAEVRLALQQAVHGNIIIKTSYFFFINIIHNNCLSKTH